MLRELLQVGVHESATARPGAASMLAKLAELLFVEALRRHVELEPPDGRGWFAAVRDVPVGRALALLHDAPERWSASRRCSTGPGACAALGQRRHRPLAERSGCESEAAFSRAFKREFGVPPAGWRKAGAA